jgi:hypothetical protein
MINDQSNQESTMISKRIILVALTAIFIRPLLRQLFWMKTGPLDKAINPVLLLSTQELSSRVKGKHPMLTGGTRGVGFSIYRLGTRCGWSILNFALANKIMIDSLYKFDDNFSTGTFTFHSSWNAQDGSASRTGFGF